MELYVFVRLFFIKVKFLGYFCLTNSDVYACNVCVATQAKYTHM